MRWSKEIKRGAAELAILAVLSQGPSYGYEVVKRLRQHAGEFLALEQGTVYPLLRRLEGKRGLLNSEWNYDDPTRPKKYYSITEAGRHALHSMSRLWATLAAEMSNILEVCTDGPD